MKISNSKKQLAKIISENGGWPCDAEYSSQDGSDGQVSFYKCGTPIYNKLAKIWNAPGSCVHMYVSRIEGLGRVGVIKNFHQTILSRDEYFHLYPAPDADGWIEHDGKHEPAISESGLTLWCKWSDGLQDTHEANMIDWIDDSETRVVAYRLNSPEKSKSTAAGDDETNLAAKEELEALEFSESPEQRAKLAKIYAPPIEKLAADYRAKLAIAQQAQEEADSHRCGAEAALERLYQAGLAIGLDIAIADSEPEGKRQPELMITDWRDLRVGDEIMCVGHSWLGHFEGLTCEVIDVEREGYHGDAAIRVQSYSGGKSWGLDFKFIRRP